MAVQIEQQLWSVRQQIEGMLSLAGREGMSALQEMEGRLRGYSDLDLLAWETWCDILHTNSDHDRSSVHSQGSAKINCMVLGNITTL